MYSHRARHASNRFNIEPFLQLSFLFKRMMYIDRSILISILHGFWGGNFGEIGAFVFERLVLVVVVVLMLLCYFGLA